MKKNLLMFIVLTAVTGCATIPKGPSVAVMPGPGKTFEQFQADDATCRQWASQQIGMSPQDTANQNTAVGAVVGAATGALLGAAIGSTGGNAGTGALIGAGGGLLVGSSIGSSTDQVNNMEAQRRYDISYQQCMYSKGHQIPGGQLSPSPPPVALVPAPPPPPPPPPVVIEPTPPPLVFEAPPRFIYSPKLGFYVAIEAPYDLVYFDRRYYVWWNGFWYMSPYYYGPWVELRGGAVPRPLHHFGYKGVRHYREIEYGAFLHDRERYHGRWHVPEGHPGHH